jgi:hypothetical protein
VDCRCTSITTGAPVELQVHLEMPGAALECQVHLASAYLKQGAPAIPRAHLWTAGGRWTSITPGASSECQGHSGRRQGLDLWISAAAQWVLLVAPQNGTPAGAGWWCFPRLRLCAAGCLARFKARSRRCAPKSAARSAGLHLYQILKFAKFTKLKAAMFVDLSLRSSC